jgi:4-amino-4-deoxy-L-arabinose transferase-like glycosyltransferase
MVKKIQTALLQHKWLKYLLLFISIWGLYYILILSFNFTNDNGATIRSLMLLGCFSLFGYGYHLYNQKRLTYDKAVELIILMGFILRLGYGSYTSIFARQHDVGKSINDSGHIGYIYQIYSKFKLPSSNTFQFYHPPLHHIISAVFMRINSFFFFFKDIYSLIDKVKILTIFYSCSALLVLYEIIKELKLSKTVNIIALTILAVHPTFIILSASINNDMLSILFLFIALLYSIRWYKKPSFFNIIMIALSIGLGMMTKLSTAIIAPITAVIFIIKWFSYFRKPQFYKLIPQFIIFAIICIPLGLIYPLRNYLLFGQPLGFVWEVTNPQLYVGDKSYFVRFIWFPIKDFFYNLWASPGFDYNIWIYTLKCSVFGEFGYWQGALFAVFLLLFNCIVAPISLFAMIYIWVKKYNKYQLSKIILTSLWIIVMAMFISFNIKYPYGCTMDFRYIVPTLLVGSVFIGMLYEMLGDEEWERRLKLTIKYCLIGFCISSILFYSTCV